MKSTGCVNAFLHGTSGGLHYSSLVPAAVRLQHNNWQQKLDQDVKSKDTELEQLKMWHNRDLMKRKDLTEKVQQMLADRELRLAEERRKKEQETSSVLEQERWVVRHLSMC